MPIVNPEILRWARESAGFSIQEAAKLLGIRALRHKTAEECLQDLENEEIAPSRPLLLRMAKKYHRNLLVFYLTAPPRTGDRGQDFRTLPESYTEFEDSVLNGLLRNVFARQGLIRSAMVDEEEAEPLAFVGSLNVTNSAAAIANRIIELFEIDLKQFRAQTSPETAFKYLRQKVENAGVFVLLIGDLGSYHTKISLDAFRGYSIADSIAPFIVINDNDDHSAWSFTLLHELTHIMLGQTGVSNGRSEQQIEQLCNRTAGHILLPSRELQHIHINGSTEFETALTTISQFAINRNISSSSVAYRLYLEGIIDFSMWTQLADAYRALWESGRERQRERSREQDGGPSYYLIKKHRMGDSLVNMVSRYLSSGGISTTKAGIVLGVKPINVQALIETGRSVW